MKLMDVDGVCVANVAGKAISKAELTKLKKFVKGNASEKRIGINLANVSSIDYDFISFLKEYSFSQKISLFNINSDIYLMLFVSKTDKYVDMYLDESDFRSDKNSIVYRRLKLLKSA